MGDLTLELGNDSLELLRLRERLPNFGLVAFFFVSNPFSCLFPFSQHQKPCQLTRFSIFVCIFEALKSTRQGFYFISHKCAK